jgi:uncharacterized linocin/CFP29 family protein
MDILKRNLSPITDRGWAEIDSQAKKALLANLSARKFVDVLGPKGWDYASVPLGRLNVPDGQDEKGVRFGIHAVLPLVESRIAFEMDVWELDNLERGAKDVVLDPVVDAAARMAAFEEKALYEGFDPGCIEGLVAAAAANAVEMPLEEKSGILHGLSQAVKHFQEESIEGPFALVTGAPLWEILNTRSEGYPLKKRVESMVQSVIYSPFYEGAMMVSLRGGDLEMTIGQDFSLGYEGAAAGKVRLFMAESFTFRILEPRAVVELKMV